MGVLSFGSVKIAPGVTVRQLGWDDNIFDEPESKSPKDDYVVSAMPDVAVFSHLRYVRLAGYAGSELTYYKTYDSENSNGYALRGRADFLLSRLRPFIAAGEIQTRERPNGEIDTRADRLEEEVSGGVAFDLSEHSLIYGSAYQIGHDLRNAFEDGVDPPVLSRDGVNYQGMATD